MEILSVLIFVIIGILAGICSGLLGIGGGIITVPCLLFAFRLLGCPAGFEMHMAVRTSLAAMIFSTTSATWIHNTKQAVRWDLLAKIIPGLFLGALIGFFLGEWLPSGVLEGYFGAFLCIMAIYFWLVKKPVSLKRTPHFYLIFGSSIVIGILAIIFGIGGGTLVMPVLLAWAISQRQAIGTASATSLFVAIIGTILYWIMGRNTYSTGFIYIPAFFIIGLVSFFSASYGARLSQQLSENTVKRAFAIILMLTGIFLIF